MINDVEVSANEKFEKRKSGVMCSRQKIDIIALIKAEEERNFLLTRYGEESLLLEERFPVRKIEIFQL